MDPVAAPARWWRALDDGAVACELCPVGCRLPEGKAGPCGTRANREGRMVPLHYGRVVSAGMDPIEKKPLYHFHPGRGILSVAAPGCNLHCLFCQNASISQDCTSSTVPLSAEEMIAAAETGGAVGIAYTYSEPLVWYEFVRDCSELARTRGLKNVIVSNGYLNPGPLAELLPLIDAANIDLKAMDDGFYRDVCRGRLDPVLASLEQIHAAGVHLEVTNLLIPGYNDSEEQVERLVGFVADLDRSVPLHFSAYHPSWRLDAPPTPRATLVRAYGQARRRLDWVYLGNMAIEEGRDTVCPQCGVVAIARSGFRAEVRVGADHRCRGCGQKLRAIRWGGSEA